MVAETLAFGRDMRGAVKALGLTSGVAEVIDMK